MLKDKVAIVTGAGNGTGQLIALKLAEAGCKVVVNDMNPDRAQKTADLITQSGGTAVSIPADVGNKFKCVHLVETARDTFGQLDILINNANVKPRGDIIRLDEWDWDRAYEVNLKGAFFMSQLVGRVMQMENGDAGGTIINIGARAGFLEPWENRAAFAASKAGLIGFSRECAREFVDYKIAVHALIPPADGDKAKVADAVQAVLMNGSEETVITL